ncbi:hypothetical protein FSARC_4241 [Fusarium sarcochroum]|uniref:AAA+ ATPase domain-containing protein n=1 Tax=Fusarium sarcochroum TaxID=1208366 RepID=A0A8H4XBM9_9HYPO|nr:hypothetical protein FSARC_4241 [Fusarium sarcochroum]
MGYNNNHEYSDDECSQDEFDAWGNTDEKTRASSDEAIGEVCQVKNVFASLNSDGDLVTWLDEKLYPQKEEKVRKAKKVRDTYSVVCGHYPLPDGTWEIQTIMINNETLKSALSSALKDKGYHYLNFNASTLEFSRPFAPLIHNWQQLSKMAIDQIGSTAQQQMSLLMEVLQDELKDVLKEFRTVKSTGYVSFNMLPLAFQPGEVIICSKPQTTACVFRSCRRDGKEYKFRLYQVTWNGNQYGLETLTEVVNGFQGTRRLAELGVRPFRSYPDQEASKLRSTLIKRGRKYEELRGMHFRMHVGLAHEYDDSNWSKQDSTCVSKEMVIVDMAGYFKLEQKRFREPKPLSSLNLMSTDESQSKDTINQGSQEECGHENGEDEAVQGSVRLTDVQCMLTAPTVRCFALDSKVWCDMSVDDLVDIEWNSQAFDKLVLSDSEKRLMLGFVGANKNGQLKDFDDFVDGKGKGIIILLCGPPGTGKTLTAESVSENLKRPLYRLDASDLGTTTKTLELRLKAALERCAHWDAVLLIDEADVFLEARTTHNLVQNELVAIFLRLLEYYKGVMILTTNRFPTIDPAFESRIDITLTFSDLDAASRAKVWYNFLVREDASLADDSNTIEKLAEAPLNGCQIKSAVKTARILAASENLPLNIDHLQMVVEMRSKALRLLGRAPDGGRNPRHDIAIEEDEDTCEDICFAGLFDQMCKCTP